MDAWNLSRAPIRLAGDAINLPFADNSLRFVCTFQTLSQFMDIEAVFREVHRVLQPGGVFLFAEEPLLRKLSLRLYRCPYYETMKPWERKLYDWGLLGYLVRDVIGAHQEESFGIRQNHSMGLAQWDALVKKYFPQCEYDVFAPERGWGESMVVRSMSRWRAARLLGGTLAAVCRKEGTPPTNPPADWRAALRCPDCQSSLKEAPSNGLACTKCDFTAPSEGEVYNLIRSAERAELYPGQRDDIIDFSLPSHESQLMDGWYELEGVHGNKYRWIAGRAAAKLKRVHQGPVSLRIRGHASAPGIPGEVKAVVNNAEVGAWKLDRPGLFVLEAPLPDAQEFTVEILGSPVWSVPTDDRTFSVNISMVRLIEREW